MKIKKIILFLMIVVLFTMSACSKAPEKEEETELSTDERIAETISSMSIEEKLAQMMIVAFRSDPQNTKLPTSIEEPYKELLQKYDFGGIILFAGNMDGMEKTITFIRDAQEAAAASKQGIPMFVCVDQEGGMVNRVSFGVKGPGNMALAAAGDLSLTTESADLLGQEITALGFNMDFAPVSDVNNNPDNPIIGIRSFSDDPELVSEHVKAFLQGLQNNNISAALKHFPGHGNVSEDSHTGLPLSLLTVEELKNCELLPFEAGISAGADMIMTAHIQYPNIETGTYISKLDGKEVYLPATLSHTIITGLLREELGYDGVVITDAMGMDAIASHFDPIDAAVLAINAGIDILLCPVELYQDDEINTFPAMDAYIEALSQRVRTGEIKEEELDDSVSRILKLKYEKGIMSDTLAQSAEEQLNKVGSIVGTPEHLARDWQITQKAMTLLKNEGNTLPLDGNGEKQILILVPNQNRMPSVEYALTRLQKEGLLDPSHVKTINYGDLQIEDEELQDLLKETDQLVVLSQSTKKNDLADKAISYIQEKGGRAVLLSLNLPYDAAVYEDADAILCAYNPYGSAYDEEGNGPFNMNLAVGICTIFNQTIPQGKIPVNIPKAEVTQNGTTLFQSEILYERGSGLSNWGNN